MFLKKRKENDPTHQVKDHIQKKKKEIGTYT